MHGPAEGVKGHFRNSREADWDRLAAAQSARIAEADSWWSALGEPVGRSVADIGCGPGLLAHRLAQMGADVLAVDLRADALGHVPAHPRLRTLCHDIEASPLPERVDAAVLADVLHHADAVRVLGNLRRCAATVLVAETEPGPANGPPQEHRLAPQAVQAMLGGAGYAPEAPVWTAPGRYLIVARGLAPG